MQSRLKECEEQKKLIQYLRLKNLLYFAPMNENQASFTNRKVAFLQEKKAKTMGKVKGVSDVIVILDDVVLFIELKRSPKKLKSGRLSVADTKPSKEQLDFLDRVNKSKVCVGRVCYGADEAIKFVNENIKRCAKC